jgi:hypothetical protein
MAVLKRVCEDTPTPVREVNPEIPEWLAAVVEKLHAKDPAQRYQSAAEVAELLGRHLALLQHPAAVPPPAAGKPAAEKAAAPPRAARGRWAVAAVVLVCLIAGLGVAEAAGVTDVAAAVVRILTPEGTLVVEAGDPAVKVTVEGDGDLVITGAGAREVRLRPGSYRLRATKDGKPVGLDRDLVTITRGDMQVVRVRLEGGVPPTAVLPGAERGAFVLLGGRGVSGRKFDTLAEAVRGASDGDIVEIRGNGPFVTGPIKIGNQALTIRAAEGFRPIIQSGPATVGVVDDLIQSDAPLTLEGLVLRGLNRSGAVAPPTPFCLVRSRGPAIRATNCRPVPRFRGLFQPGDRRGQADQPLHVLAGRRPLPLLGPYPDVVFLMPLFRQALAAGVELPQRLLPLLLGGVLGYGDAVRLFQPGEGENLVHVQPRDQPEGGLGATVARLAQPVQLLDPALPHQVLGHRFDPLPPAALDVVLVGVPFREPVDELVPLVPQAGWLPCLLDCLLPRPDGLLQPPEQGVEGPFDVV